MTNFASMSVVAAMAVAVLLVATSSPTAAAPQRGNSFGTGNINGLLADRNLVRAQISCLQERAPCNRLGVSLKMAIPEVINNKCGRCRPEQVANAQKLIDYVKTNYPQDFKIIIDKYSGRSG